MWAPGTLPDLGFLPSRTRVLPEENAPSHGGRGRRADLKARGFHTLGQPHPAFLFPGSKWHPRNGASRQHPACPDPEPPSPARLVPVAVMAPPPSQSATPAPAFPGPTPQSCDLQSDTIAARACRLCHRYRFLGYST